MQWEVVVYDTAIQTAGHLTGKMHHSNHCTCDMRLLSEAWHDFLAAWEWDQ